MSKKKHFVGILGITMITFALLPTLSLPSWWWNPARARKSYWFPSNVSLVELLHQESSTGGDIDLSLTGVPNWAVAVCLLIKFHTVEVGAGEMRLEVTGKGNTHTIVPGLVIQAGATNSDWEHIHQLFSEIGTDRKISWNLGLGAGFITDFHLRLCGYI